MSREWIINDYSGYQGLVLQDCAIETPGPGEIRLRIEAFALNWGDMDLMRDRYSFSFPEFPARIGMEAVGIVDAIGPDITHFELGERMCTLPHFYYNRGTSAESVVIDARYVTKAPTGLTAVESTSIWMQYLTAYFPMVELSKVGPGSNVLVTAATGTAGTAALQIGRLQGATMIGTTRFEHNRAYLHEAGADHVIVTGDENLSGKLHEITKGAGINAAFDPVGGDMISRYSPALALDARIYYYGSLIGGLAQLPLVDMFHANAVFHPYSLFNYVQNAEMCEKGKEFVYRALKSGDISPSIDRVFSMEEYRDAWDYMAEPRTAHGKVVIETGL